MRKTKSVFYKILVFCVTAVFLFNNSSGGLDISHHKLATWSVNQQNSLGAEYDAFKKEVIDDVRFMTVAFSIADYFLVPPEGKRKDLPGALIDRFDGIEDFLTDQSIEWNKVSFENGIVSFHFEKNGKRGIAKICNILAQKSYDSRWKLGIRYAFLIEPEENNDIDEEDNSRWRLPADLAGKTIVTLSMEGNIPEFGESLARDANTIGGLGAYFGDKLEGLADCGMNGYGFQPGYSYVKYNGDMVKADYEDLIERGILEPVHVGDDAIKIWTWAEDPLLKERGLEEQRENVEVKVEVYRVNRGGTWDYIFMSEVFDVLYPDNRIHRFTQETVFGKAVHEFLRRHNLKPDILHLNEAHTVVAAAHIRADEFFDGTAVVYTNHTLVPAGLERFFPEEMKVSANRMMYQIGLPGNKAKKFREVFMRPEGSIDFCYAAMRLTDAVNAVSDEHAGLTERLFRELYGKDFNKEVVSVLNGSGTTWKSEALKVFERMGVIPDEEKLWQIHEKSKREIAFAAVERKTGITLDPDKPTAWALRRLVEYKSQYPILRFLVHLMCADRDRTFTRQELKSLWIRDIPAMRGKVFRDQRGNVRVYDKDVPERAEYILDTLFAERDTVNGLGMQVIVGGPEYEIGWVREFKKWTYDIPELKGRFVIVPNHDINLLKIQAVGADICIHMPRPLEEACGTSDQRTALNGGINIAVDGAGPKDWMTDYDEIMRTGSGFFLGAYTREGARGIEIDLPKFYNEMPVDMYEKLAICSRLFYEDKPTWKHLMHNAYMASTYGEKGKKAVTAEAMEQRYARDVYLTVIRKKLVRMEGIHAYIGNNEDFLAKLLGPDLKERPEKYAASAFRPRNIKEVEPILNRLIEVSAANKEEAKNARDFIYQLIDNVVELDVQIMAGQALNILSWTERGEVENAEKMRLTVDEDQMVMNDKRGKSFIDKRTLPEGVEEVKQKGKPGFFWRGIETIKKLGDNVIRGTAFMFDIERFERTKEKLVMYIMDHGFIKVPSGLMEATENGLISAMHETFFVNDVLPGSRQTTSTGAGHFQGDKLDIKHVTEGRGVQVNVRYDLEGEIAETIIHVVEAGDFTIALPGYVDYMINLEGLRFNDVSVALSPEEAKGFNPHCGFDEEGLSKMAKAVSEHAKAPYLGIVSKDRSGIVKVIDTAPDAVFIPDGMLTSPMENDSLISIYKKAGSLNNVKEMIAVLQKDFKGAHGTATKKNVILMSPDTLEKGTHKLLRIPVEWLMALGAEKTKEIKDFLAAFQETEHGYIELYSIENRFKYFSPEEYAVFGIEKRDLPDDFDRRNRGNTVTIFPVMKDEEIATSGHKAEREWNIGDIRVEDTVIAPVGWNHNKTGLITSTVFALVLSEIARKNCTEEDEFVIRALRQYREYCLSQGIESFDLTEEDLINMARGDIKKMVASLKKWIQLLPIMPVNTEELREAFEHAREVLIRA